MILVLSVQVHQGHTAGIRERAERGPLHVSMVIHHIYKINVQLTSSLLTENLQRCTAVVCAGSKIVPGTRGYLLENLTNRVEPSRC